jgi:membrane-bound lytic murein transglycosylase B
MSSALTAIMLTPLGFVAAGASPEFAHAQHRAHEVSGPTWDDSFEAGPTASTTTGTALPESTRRAVIKMTERQRVDAVIKMTKLNIPAAAYAAYHNAATVMHAAEPSCHLTWGVLAGIGQVESNHGRFGGASILASGITSRPIVGPQLDGHGVAKVRDTDGGRLDGDRRWDRAVGPMQFLPTTWAVVGVDADRDGKADPNDIDDAALAAGVYLCTAGKDFRNPAEAMAAIETYNHSVPYAKLVLRLAKAYNAGKVPVIGQGLVGTPGASSVGQVTPPAPPSQQTTRPRRHKPSGGASKPHKPSQPHKPPKPGPTPPPPPPDPALKGVIGVCATQQWCIGAVVLNLGRDADLSQPVDDYDGDGTAESVIDELTGLAAAKTTVTVTLDRESGVVKTINGLDYTPPASPATQTTPTTPTSPPTPSPTPNPTSPTSPTPTSPTPTSSSPTSTTPSTEPTDSTAVTGTTGTTSSATP